MGARTSKNIRASTIKEQKREGEKEKAIGRINVQVSKGRRKCVEKKKDDDVRKYNAEGYVEENNVEIQNNNNGDMIEI